jgi:cyclophilin family peptidyl-prolyl cis-trans isomerase
MPAIRSLVRLALLTLLFGFAPARAEEGNPRVRVETSAGSFTVELWPGEAPRTVESFLRSVDRDFYEGLVFHRVIPDFMIQTGGYEADLAYREPAGTVPNESVGGARNLRGTLAMARRRDPDSADAQFFVNVADNAHLDAEGTRPGYTVFGRVVAGMEVVDAISLVETGVREGMRNVPLEPITIVEMERVGG